MIRARSTLVSLLVLLAYASGAARAVHLRMHHVENAEGAGSRTSVAAGGPEQCSHGCGDRAGDSGEREPKSGNHRHGEWGCGLCECLAAGGLVPPADRLLPADIVDPLRRVSCVRERVIAAASVRIAGARAPPVGA
ncbi:MAG: DUF2946 family protein [Phycisphaerales bacterium]